MANGLLQVPGCEPDPEEERSKSEIGSSTSASSISTISTEEWQSRYEQDGTVDLWVEEEFNAGSRLSVSHTLLSTQMEADCREGSIKGPKQDKMTRRYS